jgi:hypothetical protein
MKKQIEKEAARDRRSVSDWIALVLEKELRRLKRRR